MAYVDWLLKGKRLVNCNCHYGCPCEFNAPPTHDACQGLEAMQVDEGYFGEVRLDGITFAGAYHWPGPVHEGKGVYQVVLDKAITEAQAEVLFKILGGEEQEPHTVFNIYGATIETELDPVIADIEFEWDLEGRSGRLAEPDFCEASWQPIRNPVTGAPHRALIQLPEGFEYREAEMASSDFRSQAGLEFQHKERYGFLTYVAYGPYGIVEA
jgi:hypothetical protein